MNWQEHVINYNKLRAERGISIREYAEHYDLNQNTARRYLRSSSSDQKNDHSSKNDHSNKPRKKNEITSKSAGVDLGGVSEKQRHSLKKNTKPKNEKMITDSPAKGELVHVKLPRGKGRLLGVGNEASIKHARYATPRQEDIESADSLIESGYLDTLEFDLMRRALSHFEMVDRVRTRAIEKLEEQEEDHKEDDGIHPVFKKLKMLNDCSYAMTDLMRTMASLKQGFHKTNRELFAHSVKFKESEIIPKAYQLKNENNWDAMETASYIEANGGKVPPALLEIMKHDLKRDEVETEGAPTDDEQLEREAIEYRNKQKEAKLLVEKKRLLVAEIVDSGGYGDHDIDGEAREGELLSLDDDLDIDFDATSDIYDDDEDE